jgi:hypothetical protein
MLELTEVHVEIDDAVHAVAVDVHLVPCSAHVQAHILHTGNTYCSQGTHIIDREHILHTGNTYCSQGTHTTHREHLNREHMLLIEDTKPAH